MPTKIRFKIYPSDKIHELVIDCPRSRLSHIIDCQECISELVRDAYHLDALNRNNYGEIQGITDNDYSHKRIELLFCRSMSYKELNTYLNKNENMCSVFISREISEMTLD